MGQAEANMIQMAPYQQLLSSLAADVPYKLLGGAYGSYDIPGILGKNVPSGVETALNNLGVSTAGLTSKGVPTLPPVAGSNRVLPLLPRSPTQSLTAAKWLPLRKPSPSTSPGNRPRPGLSQRDQVQPVLPGLPAGLPTVFAIRGHRGDVHSGTGAGHSGCCRSQPSLPGHALYLSEPVEYHPQHHYRCPQHLHRPQRYRHPPSTQRTGGFG